MRKGFFRSPLMRPATEDEGDIRSGELPEELLLALRSMLLLIKNGRKAEQFLEFSQLQLKAEDRRSKGLNPERKRLRAVAILSDWREAGEKNQVR
jgi:hypothetical protein